MANKRLPAQLIKLLTLLLWVLIAVLVARVSWWLVVAEPAAPQSLPAVTANQPAAGQGRTADISGLQQLNLFGSAPRGQNPAPRQAPKTSLNLRLVGVAASTNPNRSAAIIEQGAQQQTYVAGDAIAGSSVTVQTIYADRVILDNNGRLETLQLEDIGEDRPALSLVVDEANNSSSEQPSLPSVAQVTEDPQALTDYVAISPALEQGKLIGYRLQPGTNPALFNQAGFQAGDLAVAINGYDLTDAEQAMQISRELNALTEVSIQVIRQGQPVELSLELPQSQDN